MLNPITFDDNDAIMEELVFFAIKPHYKFVPDAY